MMKTIEKYRKKPKSHKAKKDESDVVKKVMKPAETKKSISVVKKDTDKKANAAKDTTRKAFAVKASIKK